MNHERRLSRYGKMRASFDSEGTSLGPSPPQSPPRSTRGGHGGHPHPMYYVQSPSRESFTFNEGDSLSQSYARSTPSASPLASPLHHKSYATKGHQQEVHHFSNVAGSNNSKPGSRRVLPQPANISAPTGKKGYQPWNASTIDEEEEQMPSEKRTMSRWLIVLLAVVASLVFIFIVGLIFWLVCRPSAPVVSVKNIQFQNFLLAEGTDLTGVPTNVLTINATTTLVFQNPSKYFGFHVSPTHTDMTFQQLKVAEGQAKKFYQKKQSTGTIVVSVKASKIPVYGAGPSLTGLFSNGQGVPLELQINVNSRANVVWRIVRPKYTRSITCDIVVDSSKTGNLKLLQKKCKPS
ncbi:hypothetical protein R1sor_023242 [Riccia sorocarpa]|uniref:Late embryogenesis abundant protein LEA-2 subgroup domain-containing protein n=1 Tax=Riccia sorocarpa TaxID=122646 RepID=A0ABD3GNM4_9MARC